LVTMLLALFCAISFSGDAYRIATLILYALALLLTLLNRRYWITYIWFAVITTLSLLFMAAQLWLF
ncbi:MAG: hypothetical protein ACXVPK_01200, partial [Tumebacillaceae bacterium]